MRFIDQDRLRHISEWLRTHGWQKLSPRQRFSCKILLTFSCIALGIRLTPYLVPVRAKDILQTDRSVEFRDRNGLPLGTLLSRNQDHTAVVSLQEISPAFLQAIIAAEDGRFYQHGPVDHVAVGRAVLEAIQARQVMSGASTITMQLARMVDPTPSTIWGKFQEIWLAWRMGAGMNHDDILSAYVNRLPMGGNLYGVEAAAQAYFGSSAKDLNLAQASLLAAIPNDPNQLNPYEHRAALKNRQRYVLEQMQQDGYISVTQLERVMAEKVHLKPRQQGMIAAPHFLFWLSEQLPPDHPAQVNTTLDLSLQRYVQAQVKAVIRDLTAHQATQASALVVDNATGEVLAYVGSTDYFDARSQGRNDGVQALRQPGSTLKPFLYALALEQGVLQPNSILADIPTSYAIPGGQLYQPLDYHERFLGPVRVRVALANSLNVPAVRLLERVTVQSFLHQLQVLKFTHLKQDPEFYGLGLALGSGEVTLWELAQAYVALANQGEWTPLQPLSQNGSSPTPSLPLEPHLQADVSAFVTDILSDRYARAQSFGVDSALSLPFPAAVKTGTSSDYRDTWTIGFTRKYTVATWVGNFDGSPMQNVSGVVGAAPLWNRIMLHLHEHHEPPAFDSPQGWLSTPICAVSGQKPTPTCPTLVEEYLNEGALARYHAGDTAFFDAIAAQGGRRSHQNQLPPAYDEWIAQHPDSTWVKGVKIVSPKQGDTYLIQAGSEDSPQLEFKVAGLSSADPLQWRLNGRLLPEKRQSSWFWPVQPGEWTLTVENGNDMDQLQFRVVEEQEPQNRKGFSMSASQP